MMWLYKGTKFEPDEELLKNYVGFVYCITNLKTEKKYIGKKLFSRSKTYQKNKKKKRMKVESDWNTYTGSNEMLNEDISNGHQIIKEILYLCESKSWMTYLETKEQFARDVLLDENYYNHWIMCKVRKAHLQSKRLKQ